MYTKRVYTISDYVDNYPELSVDGVSSTDRCIGCSRKMYISNKYSKINSLLCIIDIIHHKSIYKN